MKSNQSLIYKVSIVLLTIVTLVFIAMPSDSNFKSFSDSVGNTLGRDVSMVSSVQFAANEGSSLFLPEKIDRLLAFSVPQAMSSFIFPRDSIFTYKDGLLIVSDRLSNELTRLQLGEEVNLSFEKTDINIGSAFKIPKLDNDYFVVAVSGSTVRNFLTIGNSPVTGSSKYSSLSPVAMFSDLALVSEIISSDAYKAMGDILNDLFSFTYSGDSNIETRRDELLKKFDQATVNTELDGKLDDKVKNNILAVYAITAGLIENGTNFDDDRYNNLLSGIQVELSSRILQSNKSLAGISPNTNQIGRSLKASTSSVQQPDLVSSSQATGIVSTASSSNSAARAVSKPIEPQTLNGILNVTLPAKAKVGSNNILTPCEATKGYLTHYLQDRECTGANIITIPMGVFNLIYNSSKPDDSFYGIKGAKTSFDEYITSDLKFYITAQDQKIPLVKSANSLVSSFVWGVSPFKVSGSGFVREEKKSGFKYVYAKAGPSDTKYRLVRIQLLDNSRVIELDYTPVSPFNLRSFEYRPKKEEKSLARVTIQSGGTTYYGTEGIWINIHYPSLNNVLKDVNISSFHGAILSVGIGSDEFYDFNNQGSPGKYFPVAVSYRKKLNNGEGYERLDNFFGYDIDGTRVYAESNRFNKYGKKTVRFSDYSYSLSAFTYKDNFKKSGENTYRNLGGHVLKVGSKTPFGIDIYEYKAPLYSFYKHYSSRDKKWDIEVLKFEDGLKEVKFNKFIKLEKETNTTIVTTIRDLNNKEIYKGEITDKGDAQFVSTITAGQIKQTHSKTNVPGSINSFKETQSTEVAGKKEEDVSTLVSDTLVQVNNLVRGSTYKEVKVGDKVTETYSEPNQAVYTKETTSSTSNKLDTTQIVEKVGTKIVSKSVTKSVEEPAGTSWVVDKYVPVEGSTKWRQYSSSYDATRNQSDSKESISPVGGR